MFQSCLSAIQTLSPTGGYCFFNGFNPASVRFKLIKGHTTDESFMFQSCLSAIQTEPEQQQNGAPELFQSCLSAIQTRLSGGNRRLIPYSFNPASVRFKPYASSIPCCCRRVSILPQCDSNPIYLPKKNRHLNAKNQEFYLSMTNPASPSRVSTTFFTKMCPAGSSPVPSLPVSIATRHVP